MAIKKEIRDQIVAQSLQEIQFSRLYKQGKIKNWQKNEDMYYGRKLSTEDSRANVELGKMQGYVHTILSKIDNPLVFKYKKGEEADLKPAKRLNALREKDAQRGNWDFKDLLGKKQAVIYGRAIYCYHAENVNGQYKSILENVDVYDFLIDPSGGGMDLELAFYMGRYGVVKTRDQLKAGKKSGLYLAKEVDQLTLNGSGNNTEINQEVINERNRYADLGATQQRELYNPDKYKFWEWYTTFQGVRYYLLIQETSGVAVRIEKLDDIFPIDPETNRALWPFWTWAAFPDLTEFWTPSYCDYVREIFMAQSKNINQMLDNAEQVNKPQKAINVQRIKNTAEVKYKKDGIIKVTGDTDVNQAIKIIETPELTKPLEVYKALDQIQQVESGINNGAKGVAEEDKVGIYEGNQANTADRFGLLNKSYAFGYKRFALLYQLGTRKITKPVAIQMIGADGVEVENIVHKNLKPIRTPFDIIVEASNAEVQADSIDKRNKITFLSSWVGNQGINQNVLFEMQAEIAGLSPDDIKRLLDVDNFADAELMSEAARDIQRIISGEKVEPNQAANNAYKQKIVDYMRDKQENLTQKQFLALAEYVQAIDPFVMPNMVKKMNDQLAQMGMLNPDGQMNHSLTNNDPTDPPIPNQMEEPVAIQ